MNFRTLKSTVKTTLFTALVAASSLAVAPAFAQQKLVPAQSEIAFSVKQMGVPVEGKFRKFDAAINFDAAKLDTSKINFTVDLGSVTMGSPEPDAELPKATWFNAAKFPQATFVSSTVKALGAGKYEVAGKLTIKGSSRDVVVPVAMTQATGLTTAIGVLPIKRLAFKIGENEWADTSMVADDVQIKFKFALAGVGKV